MGHRLKTQKFIQTLKCNESHYCRSASAVRVYFSPESNIRKLWRLYNSSTQLDYKVRECFFRQVFNTKYNIGFGTPATDVCSTCLCLREEIKRANSEEDKIDVMTELRVHKLRATSFFLYLKR